MIWLANPTDPLFPVAKIFRLAASPNPSEPERLYNYNSSMDLIVVTGRIPEDVTHAVALLHNKAAHSITIAVMTAKDIGGSSGIPGVETPEINRLHNAFDCVFIVNSNEADNLVNRLARAIVTPGSSGQHACCDWNDMLTIVRRNNAVRLGRFGFGCGQGPDRMQQAALAALHQIKQQECGIADANGVLVHISGNDTLQGRQIKECMNLIRREAEPSAQFAVGIAYDPAMLDDVIEVDFFAFGGPAACLTPYQVDKAVDTNRHLAIDVMKPFVIPEFLRQRHDQ